MKKQVKKPKKKPIKKVKKEEVSKKIIQPEISIGLVGHVDHGKTSLVAAISGKWTDTHSEELKRGITIRLGYADATFYKCPKCKDPECYGSNEKCPICKSKAIPIRKVSFVDAPGHETLMATMLSGAAIMDAAILVIAANEKCPQPQTKEHLMALEIVGIKNIIIIQNKIDLIPKEEVIKNYNDIKTFLKGTIAENVPIIPISAQHKINLDVLIKEIEDNFKSPKRDSKKDPLFYIARSFDVNKPGSGIKDFIGGVLGGALKQGKLSINDEIEIKPGIKTEKEGKTSWEPVQTKICGLHAGNSSVKDLFPGGSSGILTYLDPSIVKADNLTGNVAGLKGKLPEVFYELKLKPTLLKRVVGAKDDLVVEPIKLKEILMLNVNSAATVGTVTEVKKDAIKIVLKLPVCAEPNNRVTISRMLGHRWRLIGYSEIIS